MSHLGCMGSGNKLQRQKKVPWNLGERKQGPRERWGKAGVCFKEKMLREGSGERHGPAPEKGGERGREQMPHYNLFE